MNLRTIIPVLLIALVIGITGCGGNKELDKDAAGIADIMCRNIDAMNKIRDADPADSALLTKLHAEAQQVQIEMTILYKEFEQKYGEKAKTDEFNKAFAKSLRKFMLECPHLTKEDRAQFEKELED
jgi:hypothetical protein